MIYAVVTVVGVSVLLGTVWFANPFGVRDTLLVQQIVKMRVSPARLELPKTPGDYGMDYSNVGIVTDDGIRLSAWEIPAHV